MNARGASLEVSSCYAPPPAECAPTTRTLSSTAGEAVEEPHMAVGQCSECPTGLWDCRVVWPSVSLTSSPRHYAYGTVTSIYHYACMCGNCSVRTSNRLSASCACLNYSAICMHAPAALCVSLSLLELSSPSGFNFFGYATFLCRKCAIAPFYPIQLIYSFLYLLFIRYLPPLRSS